MEFWQNIALGFETAVSLTNLFYCFIGVFLGTAIGVLPGLGPLATIAMLLPITYGLPPDAALIMLAGIYYGSQYGGSTTAILVNLPGEVSSVVTCLDGYQMARQGRAGQALAVAALGSFFAGTVGTILIAAVAPLLTQIAFEFGPAEYFALMVLGLVGAVVLAHGSIVKAVGMIILGLLLGLVGADVNSPVQRFTFGITQMADGIDIVSLAMGTFAFAEIIRNLEKRPEARDILTKTVTSMWLSAKEFKEAAPAVLRGTAIGSILGVLPGGGALLASFASYAVEKKLSKNPERFGTGEIRGVAGPESANNAGAQTAFIPLLTLGIPATATMALMIGAMMIHNIQPGPQVMASNPSLFWGLIASMWIGNAMLVVLNLPLIGLWIKLLEVPYKILYPSILLFCVIGVFSVENSVFDIYVAAFFGLAGYVLSKLKCELAPMMLGFVLGPMMEEHLRRAMLLARGDATVFLTQPISATLLAAAVFLVALVMLPSISRRRTEVFAEEEG
jgi:TctA family transporter